VIFNALCLLALRLSRLDTRDYEVERRGSKFRVRVSLGVYGRIAVLGGPAALSFLRFRLAEVR
jgi:hypothetical protein